MGGTVKYEDYTGTTTSSGNLVFSSALRQKNIIMARTLEENYGVILANAFAHICTPDATHTVVGNTAVTVRVFYLE